MKWSKSARTSTTFVLFIILSLFPVRPVLSADFPSMGEIIVTNTDQDLIFFSYLRDGFTNDINERLKSGLPITFTYYAELKRKRSIWFNSRVANKILTHKVKYDTLKKEYIYTRSEGTNIEEERVTKDYNEMRRWVTFLNGVTLVNQGELEAGKKYYVRVKAEIKPLNTPFPLRYLKFFFPFLDKDTAWQKSTPFVINEVK